MYCSKCGQKVDAQTYCPNCGAPTGFGGSVAGVPFVPASKIARHLRTVGILWVAYSIYLVLHWLLFLPFLRGWLGNGHMWMHGSDAWGYGPFHSSGWLLHYLAVVVLVRFVLSLAVGVVLLTRQPWGRVFAIVIAILTLIKPLLGTILAIYTLWVLLGRDSGQNYEHLVLSQGTPAIVSPR